MTGPHATDTRDDLAALMEDLNQRVPVLKDKMVVDLINGLEVTHEHVRVRERRQGVLDRAYDSFTGAGARRQQIIDRNMAAGLEAASVWLQNLELRQVETDRGLTLVSRKLVETRGTLRSLAQHHVALRDGVARLDFQVQRLAQDCGERLAELEAEIQVIKLQNAAKNAMDAIFDAWQAGERYSGFPPLLQAALALEELYWSPFRRYDRLEPEFRDQLAHKCIIQLRRLTGEVPDRLSATIEWVGPVSHESEIVRDMVSCVFDGHTLTTTPVTRTMVRAAESPTTWERSQFPESMPRVLSIRGLSRRLTRETARRADDVAS